MKKTKEKLFVDINHFYGEIKDEQDWNNFKNYCQEDMSKLCRPKNTHIKVFTFGIYNIKDDEIETLEEFLVENEYDYNLWGG